jgi:hypothetical protein
LSINIKGLKSGGLVGHNGYDCVITDCYATGSVEGRNAGGFVGYNNDGEISSDGQIIGGSYNLLIDSVPLIRAETLFDLNKFKELYSIIESQYDYLESIIELITNNYEIDIKFYNTYGKSKNFYIGDDAEQKLDKVNISIGFKVHPIFGTNEVELIRDIKIFIKEYIN